jgi:hypothetical protein
MVINLFINVSEYPLKQIRNFGDNPKLMVELYKPCFGVLWAETLETWASSAEFLAHRGQTGRTACKYPCWKFLNRTRKEWSSQEFRATGAISTTSRREISWRSFPARQGAEENSRNSDRNTILLDPGRAKDLPAQLYCPSRFSSYRRSAHHSYATAKSLWQIYCRTNYCMNDRTTLTSPLCAIGQSVTSDTRRLCTYFLFFERIVASANEAERCVFAQQQTFPLSW